MNIFECEHSQFYFLKGKYLIKNCKVCNHRYTVPDLDFESHVETHYDDSYFFGGKAGYPNYFEEKDIIIEHGTRYAEIIGGLKKPGKLLDVGCASGFILKGFEKYGWAGKGIEPNGKMVSYGRQEMKLDIEKTTLEDFETEEKYDLVSMIQVIGHLYDLDKSLHKISGMLAGDGLILVESWDMESAYAKILGPKWHEYSPPTVLHWFSKGTLENLFLQHGFVPVKWGVPIKKISINHAFSLAEEKTDSPILKKIIKKAGDSGFKKMKVVYPPLDIFWTVFKKAVN